jgi:hypothetical protein
VDLMLTPAGEVRLQNAHLALVNILSPRQTFRCPPAAKLAGLEARSYGTHFSLSSGQHYGKQVVSQFETRSVKSITSSNVH